jgi:hypothetical protein
MLSSQAAKRGADKRRARRHPLRYAAWIDSGDNTPSRRCLVADVSESGARIELDTPAELPKQFWLLLSRDGKVHRRCEVIWQTGEHVGARYLMPASAAAE